MAICFEVKMSLIAYLLPTTSLSGLGSSACSFGLFLGDVHLPLLNHFLGLACLGPWDKLSPWHGYLFQIKIQCEYWDLRGGDTSLHPCSHIHRRRQGEGGDNRRICHCCSYYGDNDANLVCHGVRHGVTACFLDEAPCCIGLLRQRELKPALWHLEVQSKQESTSLSFGLNWRNSLFCLSLLFEWSTDNGANSANRCRLEVLLNLGFSTVWFASFGCQASIWVWIQIWLMEGWA